jgi:hypothetical protein
MSYIKVELKYPPKNKTIFGDILNKSVDAVLKELKASVLNQNKEIVCNLHKEKSNGTIIISLSNDNKKNVVYSNFCCLNFKHKVKL